ncbi:PD-(D/E)XK nuclease family protein [Heyndrickxia sp. NPDC080065]|uniref:PD-(D/E)XK nuclease family protein n=1 Tax=Heyndrickxia sp. NPDC080065 TaxID=3390568 RepID=UPI003CFF9817
MKSLIKKLQEICTSHPFSEKQLIVDSYRTGEQILQAFVNAGYSAINIKIMTIMDTAASIIDHHSCITNKRITAPIGSFLMSSIINALKEKKNLHYLQQLAISPGINRAMYQTVQNLRLSGFTSDNIPLHLFSSKEKANDIKKILCAYESVLEEKNLCDNTYVLKKALELADKDGLPNTMYIFQPNLSFYTIEEQLVSVLLQKKAYILPIAPVFGIDFPSRYPFIRDAKGEPTDFSYLFDENINAVKGKELQLFASNTEENELNEVLRRIKQKGSSFDSCAIFYSTSEPYRMMMYQIIEKLRIPVTFGEGLPITISRPGKLAAGIINWLKNQFNVTSFLTILQEEMIDFGKDSIQISTISMMLKEAGIGWGKERYILQLQKQIDRLIDTVTNSIDEKREYFQNQLDNYIWLQKWFKQLFHFVPNNERNIEIKSLIELFHYILANFTKIQSPLDETAKNEILNQLDSINPYITETFPLNNAIMLLEDLLLNINIGASGPKPGAIHFTSYRQGMFIDRPHIFFIGFDHHRFPGKMLEDPLLLDQERKLLDPNLPLLTEKMKESMFHLLQLFACTNGYPTISYSIFDQNENRLNQPSYFFLKCYRYQSGDRNADFDTINKKFKKTSFPLDFNNRKEWWYIKLNEIGNLQDTDLLNEFAQIVDGIQAKQARQSVRFTEFDGKIQVDENILDPRKNSEIRMSSGKLEKLAACPYKYFLEDVLKISPQEETVYEPNVWLDARSRGILLHEIYEQFYRTIQKEKEMPSYEKHERLLLEITKDRINSWKEKILPPSNTVFEQEVNEILQSSRVFLKSEEEYAENSNPIYFEYSFGIGEKPPAIISLSGGDSFYLSGKIDRVDKNNDSVYSIVDYKTGRAGKYSLKKYFNGGRQLQHYLYAKALESNLQLTEGQVKTSSYLFPTIRGTGERRERLQDFVTRENGRDILERLLDVLKFGHFTMTDSTQTDCTYCDYKHVCKRSTYTKEMYEGKGLDNKAIGLQRWIGVRAYE